MVNEYEKNWIDRQIPSVWLYKTFAILTVGYTVVSALLFGLPFIVAYGLLQEYPNSGWLLFWNYWNILSICVSVIGLIIGQMKGNEI